MIINKVNDLKFSGIAEVVEKANKLGGDVIRLEVGDLDINTSEKLKMELKKAIDNNVTHYPALVGNKKLIKQVVDLLKRENLNVSEDNILITSGGSMGMYLIFASLINENDEILVPMPIWPHLPEMIKFCGGKVVPVNCDKNFHLDFKDILHKIGNKTKAILLNSPNNPTGVIYSKEELNRLKEICEQNNLSLIVDEEYCDFNYSNNPFASAINLTKNTFVSRSFSKKYAIAGLRLGYIVADAAYISQIKKLSLFTSMYSNSVIQEGLANYINTEDEIKFSKNTQELFYNKMKLLVEGFKNIKGLKANYSEGGMYVWLDVSSLGNDKSVADLFLYKANVATVPGSFFGENGENYLRVSLGASEDDLLKALKRIKETL